MTFTVSLNTGGKAGLTNSGVPLSVRNCTVCVLYISAYTVFSRYICLNQQANLFINTGSTRFLQDQVGDVV